MIALRRPYVRVQPRHLFASEERPVTPKAPSLSDSELAEV